MYVVTRPLPRSGLGSNLASMAGAWWLAKELGRELIVDWRGMVFLKDPAVNYFTRYLAEVPELEGVRIHYAPSAEAGDHVGSDPGSVLELAPGERLEPASLPRYVVLTRYHGLDRLGSGDPVADHFRLRRLYRALAPRPEVQAKLDAFWAEQLEDAFVVGLNIATGNVRPAEDPRYGRRLDTSLLEDRERLLARIRTAVRLAVRRLPRQLRDSHRVFYATESDWSASLLARIPNAHTRRRHFPPPDTGRYFSDYESLGYTDVEASEDMVIDHFLLAKCNALVYNGSMFNNYARVVTDYFNGNCRNIESLSVRWWVRTGSGAVRRRVGSRRR